jgi:hypothetical protein
MGPQPSGLCMALCTPRPLRSLQDMCNDHAPRVSLPALTSDQPLEYRKIRKKINIPIWAENL